MNVFLINAFILLFSFVGFIYPLIVWWATPLRIIIPLLFTQYKSCSFFLCEIALSLFLFGPLIWWAYFIKNCSVFIFAAFFSYLLLQALSLLPAYLFLFYYKKKSSYTLASLFSTTYIFSCYITYKLPHILTENLIYPFAYPLITYAIFPELLWPCFYCNKWIFAAIYYVLISTITHHAKTHKSYKKFIVWWFILHSIYITIGLNFISYEEIQNPHEYIGLCNSSISCNEDLTYAFEKFTKQLATIIKNNPNKTVIITPEGYFGPPLTKNNLPLFCDILPNKKFTLIFGGHYQENESLYNCAFYVSNGICKNYHHKTHAMPFIEKIDACEKTKNKNMCDYTILICSELLCKDIVQSDKPIMCIVSDAWTNKWYLQHYSLLMLLQARSQSSCNKNSIFYCSQKKGLIKLQLNSLLILSSK